MCSVERARKAATENSDGDWRRRWRGKGLLELRFTLEKLICHNSTLAHCGIYLRVELLI
ncbi:hypothetical protein CASFOL_013443 [Castilleja foliolosa]|uniref:Uncharacterized protein n=1 Tax=Castilleja foliolosa TaxID=1961234 RepID=A0ABD3DK01_9LAMI